jgi:hypothetical protein
MTPTDHRDEKEQDHLRGDYHCDQSDKGGNRVPDKDRVTANMVTSLLAKGDDPQCFSIHLC